MKLCFVAHLNDLSGANRSLVDLIEVLKNNNDITVIVPRKGELYEYLLSKGFSTHIIPSGMWVYSKNESKIKIIMKAVSNIVGEVLFFWYLISHHFDDMHFNSSTYGCGALSCKLLKRKYTWHIRELAEETFDLRFYDKKRSLSLIANADKVIAISNFIGDKFQPFIPEKKMVVIHNGVRIPKSESVECAIINGLLFVGAINQDKGQLDALKALFILKEKYDVILPIYFIGKITNERYYARLVEYINSHGLKESVHFEGYHQDITKYRTPDKIVLMCSKQEAFGRVTIEAFANHQIIIGNSAGATPEIIRDHEYGYLYNGSPESLADSIFEVMSNPNNVLMINESYEYAKEHFSIEITASKLELLLQSVVR